LALPLTKQMEMQLALRSDSYSDFGSALTPKVGMKYRPTGELLFRANWGRGFRAPTLPEISPSVATFFFGVFDPVLNQQVNVSGVFAGNPDLQAEKSRSTTVGFVYEPTTNFNVSVDWYEINWSNIVGSDDFQGIVNENDPTRVIRDPVTGQIVTVLNNYRNFSNQLTNGFDLDMRYNQRTSYGRFGVRLNGSYINKFEVEGTDYAGDNGFGNALPRIRALLSLDWEQGAYGLTGRINYIDSYEQLQLPASYFQPLGMPFQNGTYPRDVASVTTFDLVGRWNVTPKLTLTGSVVNITDEKPPYDPQGNTSVFTYDFTQYSVVGIQFRIGAAYRFF
jgi:iron complex outermembrane receptor protein